MVVSEDVVVGDVVDQSICGKLKSPHKTVVNIAEYTDEHKAFSTDKGALGHR